MRVKKNGGIIEVVGITKSQVFLVDGKIPGAFRLLYSHDTGFTRYCIEITKEGFALRLNEHPCFLRSTFEKMAKVHGIKLTELKNLTFCKTHIELGFI